MSITRTFHARKINRSVSLKNFMGFFIFFSLSSLILIQVVLFYLFPNLTFSNSNKTVYYVLEKLLLTVNTITNTFQKY